MSSPDVIGRRLGTRYAAADVPAALSLFFVPSSRLARVVVVPFVSLLVVAEFVRLHVLLTVVAVAVVAGESAVGRLSGVRLQVGLA